MKNLVRLENPDILMIHETKMKENSFEVENSIGEKDKAEPSHLEEHQEALAHCGTKLNLN